MHAALSTPPHTHRGPLGSYGSLPPRSVPLPGRPSGAPCRLRAPRDTHRVVQLRFLAVHRVPHVAAGEEWRAPGRSLGSWRLSGVPLFDRHPGADPGREPCSLRPKRGAKRPGHQRPAAEPAGTRRRRRRRGRRRRGWGGGGRGRVRFDGRAFNSFRPWRAPVAIAAASCWGPERPSAPTTGVRAAGAPNSCHPAPAQAQGTLDTGAGAAEAFSTSERASLGFQERETSTNFEAGGCEPDAKRQFGTGRRGWSFGLRKAFLCESLKGGNPRRGQAGGQGGLRRRGRWGGMLPARPRRFGQTESQRACGTCVCLGNPTGRGSSGKSAAILLQVSTSLERGWV